ncbi:MAG: hypothetical protein KIT36_02990 [Alphaproteobacteria bacterium]|nr:hypothetical protein [Alphaproteobacteria bacterium]
MADWRIVYENGRKSPPTPTREAAIRQAGMDIRRMTRPQPSHIEGPGGASVSRVEIREFYVTHKGEFA